MKRAVALSVGVFTIATTAFASDKGPAAIGRIDVAFREGRALVTTDVVVARGLATGDPIYVGFGAPGLPAAFSAELLPLPLHTFGKPEGEHGTALPIETTSRPPARSIFALGRPSLAGATVALAPDALEAATRDSGFAIVRLRSVHVLGAVPSVVVRLGTNAIPLGAVTVHGETPLDDVAADLCGVGLSVIPLAIGSGDHAPGTIVPAKAPARAGDDLCVRATFRRTP